MKCLRKGFSLVELSIVLVILGLLVGGILAGQSLIRAAELRSVSADANRYQTAIAAFKDKYFALPGDMTNATSLWGARDNGDGLDTDCTYLTTAETGTKTCNGDGNGTIASAAMSIGERHEVFHAWKQMQNAGLISSNLAGAMVNASVTRQRQSIPGWNVPASRIANAGFSLLDMGRPTGNGVGFGNMQFATTYGTTLIFGTNADYYETYYPAIRPDEAWNIDTKLDDGRPGTGRVIGPTADGSSYAPDCTTTNVASTSQYDLTVTTIACSLFFRVGL